MSLNQPYKKLQDKDKPTGVKASVGRFFSAVCSFLCTPCSGEQQDDEEDERQFLAMTSPPRVMTMQDDPPTTSGPQNTTAQTSDPQTVTIHINQGTTSNPPSSNPQSSQAATSGGTQLLPVTTVAAKKPGYYVIIGCGAAAVVNHTTLCQSEEGKRRIGKRKILQIGFEDPWRHYKKHDMGQRPHLLRLPGYKARPEPEPEKITEGWNSKKFSAATLSELERVCKARPQEGPPTPTEVRSAWVAVILKRGQIIEADDKLQEDQRTKKMVTVKSALNQLVDAGLNRDKILELLEPDKHTPDLPDYRLLLVNKDKILSVEYADMIDICTGNGTPRLAAIENPDHPFYKKAKTAPWNPPEYWTEEMGIRKAVSGGECFYEKTLWIENQRICVAGAGGVGMNMVEMGLEVHNWMDWVSKDHHMQSFGLGRNDPVLKHPKIPSYPLAEEKKGRRMLADEFADRKKPEAVVLPFDVRTRIAIWTTASHLGGDADHLEITYKSSAATGKEIELTLIRDSFERSKNLSGALGKTGAFPYSNSYKAGEEVAEDVAYTGLQKPPDERYYNRIIFCAGQDPAAVGHPDQIAKGHGFRSIVSGGRMVGLESSDGFVRILGAANASYPAVPKEETYNAGFKTYLASLPQGSIDQGFVFNCANIAYANGYFAAVKNNNVNTAPEAEIVAVLTEKGLGVGHAESIAEVIVRLRKSPAYGFVTKDELAAKLKEPIETTDHKRIFRFDLKDENGKVTGTKVMEVLAAEIEKALPFLDVDYRAPDPFW